jgi:orotidine-5'-phosphate decarboxylase
MTDDSIRIVFPLDVSTEREATDLLDQVADLVDVIKVGLELEKAIGTQKCIELPKRYGKPVFADFKLKDIPNTVFGAAKNICSYAPTYFNILADGGKDMAQKAVEAADQVSEDLGIARPRVIAVTVLTSMTFDNLVRLGILPAFKTWPEYPYTEWLRNMGVFPKNPQFPKTDRAKQAFISHIVMLWAEEAMRGNVDCLLSSPREAAAIKARWPHVELFCPGIRMPEDPADDQQRTMSPREAVASGVRNLIIGRPIRNQPDRASREAVIKKIREDAEKGMDEKPPVIIEEEEEHWLE